MKTRPAASLVLLLLLAALPAPAQEKLIPEHQTWLEDVNPIITKVERDVFLKLRTSREREKFIAFFWRQRDPYPDTEANEFFKTYMERVRFADQYFGIGSPKRGSQTDRGVFYLLLGPPLERNYFATQSEIWPMELWFYKGEEEYGLPAYFYLIFYQPQGLGEYRLYYPGVEGPEKLVVPLQYGAVLQRDNAYQVIKKINSELAGASLSYLPSERPYGMEAFSSTNIIAAAKALPEKKYSDGYARSYLSYKDYVETDYSHNFMNSGFQVKVFLSGGQPFVHWTIEPERMSFGKQESFYYAGFELILRMEDGRGGLLFEKSEEIPLRLNEEQYKSHERRRFAFQDMLAVIPGQAKLFFLLKNKTGKEFTSFDAAFSVPGQEGKPSLSPLLLYHGREAVPAAQKNNLKAFTFSGQHYLVNARNEFLPQEGLGCYAQLFSAGMVVRASGTTVCFEVVSLETGTKSAELKKPLTEAMVGEAGLDLGPLSLGGLQPGYYKAELSLTSESGEKIVAGGENFILLAQPVLLLPWVYSKLHPPFPATEHLRILGTQYFMAQGYEQARALLEQAVGMKDDPGSRLLLGKALYGLGRFQESLSAVAPLGEAGKDREAVKVMALDYVGLKDWTAALICLERLMAEATEVSVLNQAAECYLNLNQPERALPLIRKSLELLPSQPAVRELEERTKTMLGKK